MVDTADSKSAGSNTVRVQVSPGPPVKLRTPLKKHSDSHSFKNSGANQNPDTIWVLYI